MTAKVSSDHSNSFCSWGNWSAKKERKFPSCLHLPPSRTRADPLTLLQPQGLSISLNSQSPSLSSPLNVSCAGSFQSISYILIISPDLLHPLQILFYHFHNLQLVFFACFLNDSSFLPLTKRLSVLWVTDLFKLVSSDAVYPAPSTLSICSCSWHSENIHWMSE